MKSKWKYCVYFSYSLDGNIRFNCYSLDSKQDFNCSASTFSELLLKMTIIGIDLNEMNFNKVSMIQSVEDLLTKNKIPHLKYFGHGDCKWITYDEWNCSGHSMHQFCSWCIFLYRSNFARVNNDCYGIRRQRRKHTSKRKQSIQHQSLLYLAKSRNKRIWASQRMDIDVIRLANLDCRNWWFLALRRDRKCSKNIH